MNKILETVAVVILAAGKGTRLNATDRPKVMMEIGGRPMVDYTVTALEQMGFLSHQIVLVVGFKKEVVQEYFGERVIYAWQAKQLGTAHAAYIGMKILPKKIGTVLVLQGDDTAFYNSETIKLLIAEHIKKNAVLTLLTTTVDNPNQMGRIIRHANGKIEIIEKENLTEDQKKINEISTGTFVYNRSWFEKIFPTMSKLDGLGEYGQPTALKMARNEGAVYQTILLPNPQEWFGVNTPEELAEANRRKRAQNEKTTKQ